MAGTFGIGNNNRSDDQCDGAMHRGHAKRVAGKTGVALRSVLTHSMASLPLHPSDQECLLCSRAFRHVHIRAFMQIP